METFGLPVPTVPQVSQAVKSNWHMDMVEGLSSLTMGLKSRLGGGHMTLIEWNPENRTILYRTRI